MSQPVSYPTISLDVSSASFTMTKQSVFGAAPEAQSEVNAGPESAGGHRAAIGPEQDV